MKRLNLERPHTARQRLVRGHVRLGMLSTNATPRQRPHSARFASTSKITSPNDYTVKSIPPNATHAARVHRLYQEDHHYAPVPSLRGFMAPSPPPSGSASGRPLSATEGHSRHRRHRINFEKRPFSARVGRQVLYGKETSTNFHRMVLLKSQTLQLQNFFKEEMMADGDESDAGTDTKDVATGASSRLPFTDQELKARISRYNISADPLQTLNALVRMFETWSTQLALGVHVAASTIDRHIAEGSSAKSVVTNLKRIVEKGNEFKRNNDELKTKCESLEKSRLKKKAMIQELMDRVLLYETVLKDARGNQEEMRAKLGWVYEVLDASSSASHLEIMKKIVSRFSDEKGFEEGAEGDVTVGNRADEPLDTHTSCERAKSNLDTIALLEQQLRTSKMEAELLRGQLSAQKSEQIRLKEEMFELQRAHQISKAESENHVLHAEKSIMQTQIDHLKSESSRLSLHIDTLLADLVRARDHEKKAVARQIAAESAARSLRERLHESELEARELSEQKVAFEEALYAEQDRCRDALETKAQKEKEHLLVKRQLESKIDRVIEGKHGLLRTRDALRLEKNRNADMNKILSNAVQECKHAKDELGRANVVLNQHNEAVRRIEREAKEKQVALVSQVHNLSKQHQQDEERVAKLDYDLRICWAQLKVRIDSKPVMEGRS